MKTIIYKLALGLLLLSIACSPSIQTDSNVAKDKITDEQTVEDLPESVEEDQLSSQASHSIIKGKVIDEKTGKGLPSVAISIELNSGKWLKIKSDDKGLFEFETPTGKHTLVTQYYGYGQYAKEIEVNTAKSRKYDIVLTPPRLAPWYYSEPYPELSGFWKPLYYKKGEETIDQSKRNDKAAIYFHFPNDTLPGQLRWNDGCNGCGNLYFRHIKNGVIEFSKSGEVACTEIGCDTYQQMESFIRKMIGKQTKTKLSNKGQTLELSLGKETLAFRKIHSNTLPELSTELFGIWKPVEGKRKGKRVSTFAKNAEVVFSKRKDDYPKTGSIQYKEGEACNSEGVDLVYTYSDTNFLGLHYYRNKGKPNICREKLLLGEIFHQLSSEGCHIQFADSKNTVRFEYGDNLLVLKRLLSKQE